MTRINREMVPNFFDVFADGRPTADMLAVFSLAASDRWSYKIDTGDMTCTNSDHRLQVFTPLTYAYYVTGWTVRTLTR